MKVSEECEREKKKICCSRAKKTRKQHFPQPIANNIITTSYITALCAHSLQGPITSKKKKKKNIRVYAKNVQRLQHHTPIQDNEEPFRVTVVTLGLPE